MHKKKPKDIYITSSNSYSEGDNKGEKKRSFHVEMTTQESSGKAIFDKRTLAAIVVAAILWRTAISLDGTIDPWESVCSGIALILFGWVLFAYVYLESTKLKGWIMSNWIYQGIAVTMVSIKCLRCYLLWDEVV